MNLPSEFQSPPPLYQELPPANAGPSHYAQSLGQRIGPERESAREAFLRRQEQEFRELQEAQRRRARQNQAELLRKREQQQSKSHHSRHNSKEENARLQADKYRSHLKDIAHSTLLAIHDEYIDVPDRVNHSIVRYRMDGQSKRVERSTMFYPSDHPDLVNWERRNSDGSPYIPHDGPPVRVLIHRLSTLQGFRYLSEHYPRHKIGVLNFASATSPGGGFQNGAQAQEESLARSSNLYIALSSDNASPFYKTHRHSAYGGYYTHSMVYSPAISIFRDDDGAWHAPMKVDIITSPAVNAGHVRKATQLPKHETERQIRDVMKERMARILALFEKQGITSLVLGSFGTGVFQNDVRTVAKIWKELLVDPGARFRTSFQVVLFATPDPKVHSKFSSEFSPSSGWTLWGYNMWKANTEFDTSQDIPRTPGAWPFDDTNTASAEAQPTHEPYRHRRRPHRGRYQPRNKAYRLSRDELREIALSTLGSLDDGFYTYHSHGKEIKVDLKEAIELVAKETIYFGPDWDGEEPGTKVAPEEMDGRVAVESQQDEANAVAESGSDVTVNAGDAEPSAVHAPSSAGTSTESQPTVLTTSDSLKDATPQQTPTSLHSTAPSSVPEPEKIVLETNRETPTNVKTRIVIAEYSTLVGTRKLHHLIQHDESVQNKTIGVLNFASAKKPGGGFLNGAQAQEESLARVSTLYPSLLTPTAQAFYGHWQADPDNAFYTHSIVYSPSVALFRNDKGDWKAPIVADILTCAAVNAGEVRDRVKWNHEQREMEERANAVAKDMWRLAEKRKKEEQTIREGEMERLKGVRADMQSAADELDRSLKMLQEESEKRAGDELNVEEGAMDVDEQETQRAVEIGEQILKIEGHREEVQEKMAEIDREISQLAEELGDTHVQTPDVMKSMEEELRKDDVNNDSDSNLGSNVSEHTLNDQDATDDPEPIITAPSADIVDKFSESDNPFASPEDEHALPPVTDPSELALPESPAVLMTLQEAESAITSEMKERIFRILKVFQQQGAQHLVLGSFGTGVFQNEVDVVAGIFRELLLGPPSDPDDDVKAPFKDVFSNVVFAILGGGTVRVFENMFDGVAEKDDEVIGGSGSEDEPMGGGEEVPQRSFWNQDASATTTENKPDSTSELPPNESQESSEGPEPVPGTISS
ncbi:hypothetical protein CVT24_012948 [Panaeolus cyanescens]|uniref:Microbial-type PARG catalytic domain-containing protein n=1 Tax=Panaeolus cyanescens TaxID=181874 RepID=A0A409W6H5_9AGAR|nr:hypothetical protein CVT24_012948 [Panaeolus cyanescens]